MTRLWIRIVVSGLICIALAVGLLFLVERMSTQARPVPTPQPVFIVTILAPTIVPLPTAASASVRVVEGNATPVAIGAAQPTRPTEAQQTPTMASTRVVTATRVLLTGTAASAPATAAPARNLPARASVGGLRYERQGFNNCGPATISMQLNALGAHTTQDVAMAMLRPINGPSGDRNVGPRELVAFAEQQGFRSRVIQGASVNVLKALVAAGIPPIAETWFIPEPNDEMGHYELLVGYDGDRLNFYDSYRGPNVTWDSNEFDALWRVFNRLAVVTWKPEQDAQVRAILGPLMDDAQMYSQALATARNESFANPADRWAQFNIGTSALKLGDLETSVKAFDAARRLGWPWRTLWYQFGPYQAYFEARRYDDVIALSNDVLGRVNNLEESYYWRAQANAAKGRKDLADLDMATVRRLKPNFDARLQAYP